MEAQKDHRARKLAPIWKGLYRILGLTPRKAYKFEDLEEKKET